MSARPVAPRLCTYAESPRRSLRIETDICPKVPNDFQEAWLDAVLEQHGYPIEQDDTIPVSVKDQLDRERKESQDQYAKFLALVTFECEMDRSYEEAKMVGLGDSYNVEDDYGDFDHERMRRNPMTGSTYDDWYE